MKVEAMDLERPSLEVDRAEGTVRLDPTGRRVVLDLGRDGGTIEVWSPTGDVEFRLVLTDGKPVLQVFGGRIEMQTPEAVAVRCRRFEVDAVEQIRLATDGEVRAKAKGEVRVNGEQLFFNCDPDYHGSPRS